jgi:hypothetical protein
MVGAHGNRVNSQRRSIFAGGLSLAVHALVLGAGLLQLDFKIEIPEIELEFESIELVDPDLAQGKVPVDAPPEESGPPEVSLPQNSSDPDHPSAEETNEDATKKKDEAKDANKGEKPPQKFGDKDSRVDRLGPPSSTFFALLANKRIAKLPFAQAAADIMAPLPDFEYIIEGGGFHPWKDFDAIVIASSDIRDATQTFLAVQSPLPVAEIKINLEYAAAKAGENIVWEQKFGFELGNPRPIDSNQRDLDPRWFVFLPDGVAIYVREEFLPALARGPGEKKSAGNFVASISKLRSFLAREPRAGLQVVFRDMRAALKRVKGLPFEFPNNLEIFAEAAKSPEIVIKLEFLDASQAKGAETFWRKSLREIIKQNLSLRLLVWSYYESTTVEREDNLLILRNHFSTEQAEMVLSLIAGESAKQMRRSKEQIDAARKAREELWEARKDGKLSPSQARAAQEAKKEAEKKANGQSEQTPMAPAKN